MLTKNLNVTDAIHSVSHHNRELFAWLWNELTLAQPTVDCRKRERYIGLYISQASNNLFARIDDQRSGLKIGISNNVLDRVVPKSFSIGSFAEWKERLDGILLSDKEPEMVDILCAAFIERKEGKPALQRFVDENAEVDRLLKKVTRDIAAQADEEAPLVGRKLERYSTYYERKPETRAKAVAIHGTTCMVRASRYSRARFHRSTSPQAT